MSDSTRPVALVTGASKRIGAAIARTLHREGYTLALHYSRSETEVLQLANDLNQISSGSAAIFRADLCNLSSIKQMSDKLVGQWGRVDAVVNNASTFYPTPLENTSEEEWDDLLNSNLKGPYFLVKYLANSLRQRRGSVVNITDINARYPLKDYPVYCIAKAGKVMLTRTLARELAPDVNVNAVAPGSILWPEGKAEMTDQAKARTLNKIPLQRVGTPEDIAGLVSFLVKTPGYITGQVIAVDGGLNMQGDKA